MSNYIIKKLTNLRKVLDSMGYTRESNYIYQLTKTAVPLLDVLPLDKGKPAPLFEDRGAWSKSIHRIKANVIAIPFDEDALSREDKKKIMSIWGFKGGTFKDFKNKISLITPPTDEHSLRKNHKVARVEKLESQFPELWRRISPILSGAKLDKNEAVYVLYNTKVPEGDVAGLQFVKTPRYFAHDLGHWTYDFSFKDEGDDWTPKDTAMLKSRMIFKNKIEDFMRNISKFYVDENGKSPRLDEPHLDLFFDNATSPVEGDKYSDVFANAASEEGILSTYKSPKEIMVNGKRYSLREEGSLEKESLEQNFFREMNDYVSASEGGPLTDTFGQVIFYDIV